jgi:U3 small nucleolar RNA-associated protein 21
MLYSDLARCRNRERNKPIQPPVAPKLAPFFLPTLPGLEPAFAPEGPPAGAGEEGGGAASRVIDLAALRPTTKFVKLLRGAGARGAGGFQACAAHLEGLGPAAIDLEIRSLSGGEEGRELGLFLDMVADGLRRRERFELLQARPPPLLTVFDQCLASV